MHSRCTCGLTASSSVSGTTQDVWTFEGTTGQVITINNNSFGVSVQVFAPSGDLLAENAGNIAALALPETGTYTVALEAEGVSLGNYTLTLIEVQP